MLLVTPGCETAATYSESGAYHDLAWAFIQTVDDLYGQNIAGGSGGSQNATVSGQGGGTVTITGTATGSTTTGITTVNLSYKFTNFKIVKAGSGGLTVSITKLNGTITQQGTWRSATALQDGYTDVALSSSSLAVEADLSRSSGETTIVDSGSFYLTKSTWSSMLGDDSGSYAGSYAGHEVSWAY